MLTEEKKQLYEKYFQKSSDYYIEQLENYDKQGRYTFNVSAFFLVIFWMSYRKMYLQTLIVITLVFMETYLEELLLSLNVISTNTYEVIDKIVLLILAIIIGLMSNRLYISKSRRDIKKVLAENSDPETINALIQKKGGVSWNGPLTILAIIAILVILTY